VKVGKKRELEDMEIDEEDKTAKKTRLLLSLTTKCWQGCRNSPARSNEGRGSKLPGAWEPADS
jgi:hypothetical protein